MNWIDAINDPEKNVSEMPEFVERCNLVAPKVAEAFWDVGDDEYHAQKENDSASRLKTALNSLEEYYRRHVLPKGHPLWIAPKESTADQIFGTRFHRLLLQPDEFAIRYAIEPSVDPDGKFLDKRWKDKKNDTGFQKCRMMTQKQKDFLHEWTADNAHKEAIDDKDYQQMLAMKEKVFGSYSARQLVELPGQVEYACQWTHDGTELPMKGKWDKPIFGADVILNVKTSREYTREGFKKQIQGFGYDLQSAVSVDGYRKRFGGNPRYVFLMVSKHEPHEVETYELGDLSIAAGRAQYEYALSQIRSGHDTGYWRSPTHGRIVPIDALSWHLKAWGAV